MYSERQYLFLFQKVLGVERGNKIHKQGLAIQSVDDRLEWYDRLLFCLKSGDLSGMNEVSKYKVKPVDPRRFVEDEFYLDKHGILYPAIMEEFVALNSGYYEEAVMTGGIGSGKTTIAHYTTAYQLYLLTCLRNPHAVFGLDSASEIMFILQSLNYGIAKNLEFNRFKALIDGSYYFSSIFTYNKEITSKLIFPNRIEVHPVSGMETATIGQNVIGGIIDEVNFMAVTENSKLNREGGVYDQAWTLYNSIARRRKSRFLGRSKLPGMLCLVSSKRYPGQFTDLKEQEAVDEISRTGTTKIFIYDKRVWDVKPADTFTRGSFKVFVGDDNRKPRVLLPDEEITEDMVSLVIDIPEEYRHEFDRDIMGALRDVAGVSTMAKFPYIMDVESIAQCFDSSRVQPISQVKVDFVVSKLEIYADVLEVNEYPRWCHIDLAKTGDHAGIAIGHVPSFKEVVRDEETFEVLPNIRFDMTLSVSPPKGGEINFAKIRTLLYKLVELGLPIRWVSLDSYQSVDMIQILRGKGFKCGLVSMDVSILPYAYTKTALYDGRISLLENDKLKKELTSLEFDTKKNKIDHPPNGSKDISDAVAGVVYGLSTQKLIWAQHGIPLTQIPDTIRNEVGKKEIK